MFWNKIKIIFRDPDLRKKIFFVLFILVLFRIGATIPIPGIDQARLNSFLAGNQFFGLLNIFSGGGLSNLSIVMLGVAPYITATIIMQLLTMIFPALKEMYHEEGEAGRQKFNQYSRILTIPLAVLQAFGLLSLLGRENVLINLGLFERIMNIVVVVTGSLLLMWLGELISEFGIGNGISLLIFAGIVARLPSDFQSALFTFDPTQIPLYLVFAIAAVLIIAGGTGGHIFPGISIGQELAKNKTEILFVGRSQGIETEIIGRYKFDYKGISSSPLPRKLSLALIRSFFKEVPISPLFSSGHQGCGALLLAISAKVKPVSFSNAGFTYLIEVSGLITTTGLGAFSSMMCLNSSLCFSASSARLCSVMSVEIIWTPTQSTLKSRMGA